MLPVSVVVPAMNEAHNIVRLIHSLRAQTQPPAEIIVVDAGSTDNTAHVAAQAGARVICTNRAYPGQARNIGIVHARYPIIACWDASMRASETALERLISPLLEGYADLVQGYLEVVPQTFTSSLYLLLLVPPFVHRLQSGKKVCAHPVACVAFRKDLWERVGGFRPWRAREDSDFRQRVSYLHPRVVLALDAISYWEPTENWKAILKKVRLYGRHNLLSGEPRDWYGMLWRIYGFYGVLGLGSGLVGGALVGLTVFGTAILGGGIFRTLRKILQNAQVFAERTGTSPYTLKVILSSTALLLSTDAASFLGWLDWLLLDKLGLKPERFPEPVVLGELSPSLSE
ncbi:MAG: glycosyltransferase [Bacteroidia bacterium]|nr:glycosyltransferase [Bacteroidia bacterium]